MKDFSYLWQDTPQPPALQEPSVLNLEHLEALFTRNPNLEFVAIAEAADGGMAVTFGVRGQGFEEMLLDEGDDIGALVECCGGRQWPQIWGQA